MLRRQWQRARRAYRLLREAERAEEPPPFDFHEALERIHAYTPLPPRHGASIEDWQRAVRTRVSTWPSVQADREQAS